VESFLKCDFSVFLPEAKGKRVLIGYDGKEIKKTLGN